MALKQWRKDLNVDDSHENIGKIRSSNVCWIPSPSPTLWMIIIHKPGSCWVIWEWLECVCVYLYLYLDLYLYIYIYIYIHMQTIRFNDFCRWGNPNGHANWSQLKYCWYWSEVNSSWSELICILWGTLPILKVKSGRCFKGSDASRADVSKVQKAPE